MKGNGSADHQTMSIENWQDDEKKPLGGFVKSTGVQIDWQDGPVQNSGINGAQVEEVLYGCLMRLRFFQDSKYKNVHNGMAMTCIEKAIRHLNDRTRDRENRQVEGTYEY